MAPLTRLGIISVVALSLAVLGRGQSGSPQPVSAEPGETTASSEMKAWLGKVEAQWQPVFAQEVTLPYGAEMAKLGQQYLAALDSNTAKASAAGDLDLAVIWRSERQRFIASNEMPGDDESTAPAALKELRAMWRRESIRLDKERAKRAKSTLSRFDQALARAQTQLTQRGRLDDALLVKKERADVAAAWLEPGHATTVLTDRQSPSAEAGSVTTANKEAPFTNTLGMKFVPVPILGGPTAGQRLLFSIWDTRVQDYEVFAAETQREWPKTGFPQGPADPAVNVSWEDARLFCQWLTEREQAAGRLPAGWSYRLPSDHEWSCAVELGAREDAKKLPTENNGKIDDAFPWGAQWPPPQGAGNYAGEELRAAQAAGQHKDIKELISGYNDGFAETSPVGSFKPNRFGLYDMGGNVWQWCEDWFDQGQKDRVLRGASWNIGDRAALQSSLRGHRAPTNRLDRYGFRCVVGVSAR